MGEVFSTMIEEDDDRTVVGVHRGRSVCVEGLACVKRLHAWTCGGFGDLSTRVINHAAQPEVESWLLLSLAEAFYIAFHLKRLDLCSEDSFDSCRGTAESSLHLGPRHVLSEHACWQVFSAASLRFPYECAAYYELRTAGWMVRNGLNFGADFALYEPTDKPGHAVYCALVCAIDLEPAVSWVRLQSHVRLCHQVARGLLLCEVSSRSPRSNNMAVSPTSPQGLSQLDVQLLRVASWFPGRSHAELSRRLL